MRPFRNFAMADFHQIWSQNVFQCLVEESGKTVWKIFTLGVISPQNLKTKVGQTGTSLRAGYRSRDALQRDTVVVQGPLQGVSEIRQLFCMTYGCGATGHQICPIFGFWPIFLNPHTKTLKPSYSPGVISQNDYDFFLW